MCGYSIADRYVDSYNCGCRTMRAVPYVRRETREMEAWRAKGDSRAISVRFFFLPDETSGGRKAIRGQFMFGFIFFPSASCLFETQARICSRRSRAPWSASRRHGPWAWCRAARCRQSTAQACPSPRPSATPAAIAVSSSATASALCSSPIRTPRWLPRLWTCTSPRGPIPRTSPGSPTSASTCSSCRARSAPHP